MKKTAFTFFLGALAASIPAILAVRHYRQKDLDALIEQRLRLKRQIDLQRRILQQTLATLEASNAARNK